MNIFITGVSSGFGKAIAHEAMAREHLVVGTVRDPISLQAFNSIHPQRALGRLLDVCDHEAIAQVVAEVEATVGPIDVLINNAGYGHEGIVEESPIGDVRRQFEVNVFGTIAMCKAFLPYFRARRQGHIVNITSMGGFITMPGIAYYCSSKFAVEGFSEALAKELGHLNISVTAVAPGSFRTDWAGRSMVRSPRSIPDYDQLFDPIRARRQDLSGRQLGDPAKAARVILDVVSSPNPPTHLLLGSDAVTLVQQKLSELGALVNRYESLSRSTDG